MSEVLFEIRQEQLETGMRGYPVGYCTTSSVHPQKGLFYAGHPVDEVATWEPVEVLYLLSTGKKGSAEDVQAFENRLKEKRPLSKQVKEQIMHLPREGHPMKLLSSALLIMGMLEGRGDFREDALHLIANIEELVATVINHHAGWGETAQPKGPIMGSFASLLKMQHSVSEEFPNILKLFAILHFDHGGGNLSAFVGKAVASGLEDLYGSIAAAMSALAGPLHGRANQETLAMVKTIDKQVGERSSLADVERVLRERLQNKELLYGFGHAVLRVEDPRATLFYGIAKKHYADLSLVKTALHIREAGVKVLKENPKITNPYPNVDAISGTLLTAAGFPYPIYYTLLFGLSRACGIALQIVYERLEARGGKGTPIVRPKYFYKDRND